jgi:GNAT superfamily N-acetyltransferase
MSDRPAIRFATGRDAAALVGLLVSQLRDHGIATPADDVAHTVAALLARPHRAGFLIACDGARPIGVAAVSFGWPIEHGGRGAWLEELYVVPDARERGVGTQLLEAALDLARTRGARAVDLEIARGHERVASLYARHGFAPLERRHWLKRLDPVRDAAPAPPTSVAGGCLCGAVRYEIRGQRRDVSHCHCRSCRRAAGAPLVTWATFPRGSLAFVRGTPAAFASSPPVVRTFCGRCGTPLTYATQDEPDWIDVTVGSMDAPEPMAPQDHVWSDHRLPWLELDDDLPRRPRGHEAPQGGG